MVFGENQKCMFDSGIDAIVLGNYLTTLGESPKRDLDMLESYGLGVIEAKKGVSLLEGYGLRVAKECRE